MRLCCDVRDNQVAAVNKVWIAVNLSSRITIERASLKRFLDAKLETLDHLAAGIRNNELHGIVEAMGGEVKVALMQYADDAFTFTPSE